MERERRERLPGVGFGPRGVLRIIITARASCRMNIGQCTGAKGVTGLPLRASAVVGHRGGEREEREREEKGTDNFHDEKSIY